MLKDKCAVIVTGSSKGIGKSIIEFLLQKNLKIIGISRTGSNITHHNYIDIILDITNENNVLDFFKSNILRSYKIEGIINCCGISRSRLFLLESINEIKKIIDTNLIGTISMCNGAAKIMSKNKSGVIINISSVMVNMHMAGGIAYTTSKAALNEATKIMAQELSKSNIKVYGINMAPFESNMLLEQDIKFVQTVLDRMTIHRPISIKELGPWIYSLLATDSILFTGCIFNAGMIR